MRLALIITFSLTAAALSVHAQKAETFEAAVVKPSGPNSVFRSQLDGSQFIATRHTLAMLIASSTDLWDFSAKLPTGAPDDQELLYRWTEQMLRREAEGGRRGSSVYG